jgi:hypothetical protein
VEENRVNIYKEIIKVLMPFFPNLHRENNALGVKIIVQDEVDLDVWEEIEVFSDIVNYVPSAGEHKDAYIFICIDTLLNANVPKETLHTLVSLARKVCRVVMENDRANMLGEFEHLKTEAHPLEKPFRHSLSIFHSEDSELQMNLLKKEDEEDFLINEIEEKFSNK